MYWKYEPHGVSLCNIYVIPMPFDIPFSPHKGQNDNGNDFKVPWATYCSGTILDSAKQTKRNFWD